MISLKYDFDYNKNVISIEYFALKKTIKKIVDQWDPLDLMLHAPDDEYKSEISLIAKLAMQNRDERKLAEGIQAICIEWFDEEYKEKYDECLNIAKKILQMKNSK